MNQPSEHPPTGADRARRVRAVTPLGLRAVLSSFAVRALKELQSPIPLSSWRTSVCGAEPLHDAVRAGGHVVLATYGPPDAEQLVRTFAARVNAHANAACAIVVRLDAPPAAMAARLVRLFGRPFELSDTAAIISVALQAPVFPVFAQPAILAEHRVHVDEPFVPRDKSDVALQRAAQRLAWALERYARRDPTHRALIELAQAGISGPPVQTFEAWSAEPPDEPLPPPVRLRLPASNP